MACKILFVAALMITASAVMASARKLEAAAADVLQEFFRPFLPPYGFVGHGGPLFGGGRGIARGGILGGGIGGGMGPGGLSGELGGAFGNVYGGLGGGRDTLGGGFGGISGGLGGGLGAGMATVMSLDPTLIIPYGRVIN